MKKAYIILAHQYPEQVCRLVKQLSDGDSSFFLHVDASARAVSAFKQALAVFGSSVQYLQRFNSSWGSFGLVAATLEGLRTVAAHETAFDFVTLLSGQDYPVQSPANYSRFLALNKEKSFVHSFPLPYEGWYEGGFTRVNRYYFGDRRNPGFFSRKQMSVMNFLNRKGFFLRKQLPAGMQLYGGSQWWTLNREAMHYVLAFVKQHPGVVRFFKTSLVPDELFFQTILLNAALFGHALNIENNNLRLILFKDAAGYSPSVLTETDYSTINQSPAYFIRKVEPGRSAGLLDRIDTDLLFHSAD